MAIEAGEVFVNVVPQMAGFVTGITKTTSGLASKLASNVSNVASAAFVGLGVAAVAAIGKGISATTEWASQVRELQRVTGQTAESASGLLGVAGRLGLSSTQLATGFGILAKNISNASPQLTKYGIATRDASGNTLPFDTVLGTLADKFVTLKPGMDQAAFAMNLFGRSGKLLIPLLSKGSAGIEELKVEAEKLGLVMSQEDVDAAKDLSIAQRELGESFKGAAISIGNDFIPALTAMVDWITKAVEWFTAIPRPIKDLTLGVVILTAALAALLKVGGFFAATWSKVIGLFTGGAAAATTAAEAEAALAAAAEVAASPTVALTAATVALTDAMAAVAVASVSAAEGLVGFSVAESGLIVPTATLAEANVALTESAGAATSALAAEGAAAAKTGVSTGLAAKGGISALISKLGFLGGVAATAGTALAAYFLLGANTKPQETNVEAIETTLEKLATFRLALAQGEPGMKGFIKDSFAQAASLGANAHAFQVAAREGVTYQEVIDRLQVSTDAASQSAQKFFGPLMAATDHLARSSGQDLSSVRESIASLLDPAVVADPTKFLDALDAAFAGTRAAWQAWHAQIVATFGGASAALSEFFGKTNVSFSKMNDALDNTRARLKTWQSDFDLILRQGGDAAKTFLQDMSEQGLDSIGVLQSVAEQPKKVRDQFLKNYNDVNGATSSVADDIQSAFGAAFEKIILALRNVARAFQGLPPIVPRVDLSKANAAFNELKRRAIETYAWISANQPGGFGSGGRVNVPGNTTSGGGRPNPPNTATGGIVSFAQMRIVGEKGPEAIVPLDEWDRHRAGGGGSQRIVGTLRMQDWRQGIVELDGELAWEDLARRS